MAQAAAIIVGIVRRRDLDGTRAERRIDQLAVGDDGDVTVHQGDRDPLADQVLVALVLGMDGDGGVAEHGFRARGGKADELRGGAGVGFDRITKRPKAAFDRFGERLVVGDGGLQLRVPIDEAFAAKDETVAEHLEELFAHRPGADRIEREAHARPIAATAELAQLTENARFVLILPLPNALHQRLASQIMACLFFLLEDEAFDDRLGGDPGVVGARHVKCVEALHAPPADEHVLQGVVERVPHVQRAGDIGRRDDDGEWLPAIGFAVEVTMLVPKREPLLLGFFRIVLFREFDWHRSFEPATTPKGFYLPAQGSRSVPWET